MKAKSYSWVGAIVLASLGLFFLCLYGGSDELTEDRIRDEFLRKGQMVDSDFEFMAAMHDSPKFVLGYLDEEVFPKKTIGSIVFQFYMVFFCEDIENPTEGVKINIPEDTKLYSPRRRGDEGTKFATDCIKEITYRMSSSNSAEGWLVYKTPIVEIVFTVALFRDFWGWHLKEICFPGDIAKVVYEGGEGYMIFGDRFRENVKRVRQESEELKKDWNNQTP